MKKVFLLISMLFCLGVTMQASEPLTDNNDLATPADNQFQLLQQNSLMPQSDLFASSTSLLLTESSFGVADYDNYLDLTGRGRKKKNKTGVVLTIVGATCLAGGVTLLAVGITKFVGGIKDSQENMMSDGTQEDFENNAKSALGGWAMVGGGLVLTAAGIPLTIVGCKLMKGGKRGGRRHSQVLDPTLPTDMFAEGNKISNTSLTLNLAPTASALTLTF